jgi:hypothetical protein
MIPVIQVRSNAEHMNVQGLFSERGLLLHRIVMDCSECSEIRILIAVTWFVGIVH